MVGPNKIMLGASLLPTSSEPLVLPCHSVSSHFCLLPRASLSEKDPFLLETSTLCIKTCQYYVLSQEMPLVTC